MKSKSERNTLWGGGGVDVARDSCGNVISAYSDEIHSSDVAGIVSGASPGEVVDRVLREELGGSNVTSTPVRTAWPIYSKRHSGLLDERDVPPV